MVQQMIKFFFHYNKPASLSQGKPVISLHYHDKCHLVHGLYCNVSTWSKINKTSPIFVMKGTAKEITIEETDGDLIAVIS